MRTILCLALTLGFAANAADPAVPADAPADTGRAELLQAVNRIDARLDALDQRLTRLESKVLVPAAVPTAEQSIPVYKRWYVWAGAATVVAVVTTGIVVATSSKSGPAGPALTANQVCGGPCTGSISSPSLARF